EQAVDAVRPQLERNRDRLEVAVDPALREMEADLTRVKQILVNLLGNAAKFTEDGLVTLTVRPDAADPAMLCFEVRDSGIGMSPEQISRLFTAFGQADASTTRKYGGTGLGLALCKQLVAMMGGEILCESAL